MDEILTIGNLKIQKNLLQSYETIKEGASKGIELTLKSGEVLTIWDNKDVKANGYGGSITQAKDGTLVLENILGDVSYDGTDEDNKVAVSNTKIYEFHGYDGNDTVIFNTVQGANESVVGGFESVYAKDSKKIEVYDLGASSINVPNNESNEQLRRITSIEDARTTTTTKVMPQEETNIFSEYFNK